MWVKRVWWWGPVVAYASLIFWLSSQSVLRHAPSNDKLAHVVAYAVLGGLLCRAAYFDTRWRPLVVYLFATAVGALYGVTDEAHQSFVPGRTASWLDVLADLVGSALGAGVALGFYAVAARSARFTGWWQRDTAPPCAPPSEP